ncbi:MAG TPA: phosphotransferase [Vicinamibacterales bacterium]|nr:phosphotransferase [Vicinamibacterales bacterium]
MTDGPRRLHLDHDRPALKAVVDLQGLAIEGRVTELGVDGFTAHFDRLLPEGLAPGRILANIVLVPPGGLPFHLRAAEIRSLQPIDGVGSHVVFTTDDDQARAGLWLAFVKMESGEIAAVTTAPGALPTIPRRGRYTEDARLERLAFIRGETGASLESIQRFDLRPDRLTGNVENLIGSVEVPVGAAGPLIFRGHQVQGPVYLPMATTEGALVASTSRGARALSLAGGVSSRVIRQQMMRVPAFWFSTMRGAMRFAEFVRDHRPAIREQTLKVSRHADLVAIEPAVMGNTVNVFFTYTTGEAAGQNMTTSCTWHACQWLMQQMKYLDEIELENFAIEGNMSGDKKVTFQSLIAGRGSRVTAECVIGGEIIRQVLRTTPEELVDGFQRGLAGAIQVGMVGFNINFANVIAAVFTATGQDIACVHESSVGHLFIRRADQGVYASVLLPSLIVGSVGGGTHLPRQHEFLEMMGCTGPGGASRLAEIIAGYCLALDLSTLSAIVGGQFAAAHERLGRNRPVQWLLSSDLGPAFFAPGLRRLHGGDVEVEAAEPLADLASGNSIITELTAATVRRLIGHFPYRVRFRAGRGNSQSVDLIVKVKPLDTEVILASNSFASMCGGRLAASYTRFKDAVGFAGCHTRELAVYRQQDPRFTALFPVIFDTVQDDEREAYVIVMERLAGLDLMDSADDVSGWQPTHIEAALRGIAQAHAVWYGREAALLREGWLGPTMTARRMADMAELWENLAIHAAEEFPDHVSADDLLFQRGLVGSIGRWWAELEDMPRTLIHHDFNPRNLAFRRTATGLALCAYDWELAALQVPQRDAAELLAFVLGPAAQPDEVAHYLELHRTALADATGTAIEPRTWRRGYQLALCDFMVNRLAMYLMGHTFRQYGFVDRVVATARRLASIEGLP